jgi:type 1 glutamine amidotransferase
MLTVDYGQGRVFHTTMGHFDYSMECVGFRTTFQRGVEWAASGQVTQAVPEAFPSAEVSMSTAWNR